MDIIGRISILFLVFGFIGGSIGDSSDAHSHISQISSTSTDGNGNTATSSSSVVGDSTGANNDLAASIAQALEANPQLAAYASRFLGTGATRGVGATGGYDYPKPPTTPGGPVPPTGPIGGGYPGGFGGFPFLPFGGFGKGFHLNVDAGAGAGLGIGPYFPIVEKVIVIVGGGILILLLLAFLQGSISKGGFLHYLGGSFSNAIAGSGSIDLGPFHKSAAGAAALNFNNEDNIHIGGKSPHDPHFNNQVNNAFNQPFNPPNQRF